MRQMQTIVTDVRGVCLSCGSTRLHCAKTATQIKMLFRVNTYEDPRNIVLDGGPDPPTARGGGFDVRPFSTYFGLLLRIMFACMFCSVLL